MLREDKTAFVEALEEDADDLEAAELEYSASEAERETDSASREVDELERRLRDLETALEIARRPQPPLELRKGPSLWNYLWAFKASTDWASQPA